MSASEILVVRCAPFRVQRYSLDGHLIVQGQRIPVQQERIAPSERRPFPFVRDWPEYKPPFRGGFIQVATNGTVWLELPRGGADVPRSYLLLHRDGLPRTRVVLNERARVVAVEADRVYVAESDADGLFRIAVYAAPRSTQ